MSSPPANPGVSVVVTTYNHAHFLSDALDSICAQTTSPSEAIVVDDGSIDDAKSIVSQYPGVTYIRQENQGLSAARNAGLAKASGEYIAFLDADDRLCPNALHDNLAQFSAHPECAFVYGAYCNVDANGKLLQHVPVLEAPDDPFQGFLTGNLIGMHGTVLYRRAVLAEAGGFDPSLRACEDYDVYLKLSRHGKVASSSACLAGYRRHPGGMSNNIPMMLETVVKVLGRYEHEAQSNPRWMAAYRSGIAGWKKHYIELQAGQLLKSVRAGAGTATQAIQMLRVAAIAPVQTASIALAKLRRRSDRTRLTGKMISFGDLMRTSPISREFGFDRGNPVDRRYVEAFLEANSSSIAGRVLEIGDNEYTVRFGGARVTQSDVLNRYEGHASTTFVGDLGAGDNLPSDTFDCIVLTQTLHLLFDMEKATATLWRILKPGGVLLVTVPWVSPIDRGEWGTSWYWSLTPAALKELLARQFGEHVDVRSYGNVYAATAFLYGLAEHELRQDFLDQHDPFCPVIVAACVRKQDET